MMKIMISCRSIAGPSVTAAERLMPTPGFQLSGASRTYQCIEWLSGTRGKIGMLRWAAGRWKCSWTTGKPFTFYRKSIVAVEKYP